MTNKEKWLKVVGNIYHFYLNKKNKLEHPLKIPEIQLCNLVNHDCTKCIFKTYDPWDMLSSPPCTHRCVSTGPLANQTNNDHNANIFYWRKLWSMLKECHGSKFISLNDPLLQFKIKQVDKETKKIFYDNQKPKDDE